MSSKGKDRGRTPRPAPAVTQAAPAGTPWWWWALGIFLTFFFVFEIYGPAIRAPFLFDDIYLPFLRPQFADAPLSSWLGVVRPLLMLGYWFNYQASQSEPYSYHVVNVVLHVLNGILVWLIVRRLLAWTAFDAPLRNILSVFGALLFLFHPIQTESVTYVASRSETQSVFFFLAAFAVFLYRRRTEITIAITAAVLLLAAAAVMTKEHTAVLAGLLLLTDFYFNPGFSFEGIRRNWKLYAPMLLGGIAVAVFLIRVLRTSDSAGFGMKDLTWYHYFFTQCRALWIYLRMFVAPYGLNVDHDFPISRSILDHGAIVGLIALLALAVAAWIWRRKYPLASYGFFAFLLLMAPTSSIVPIRDVLVERRLYLAFFPLILIVCEALRHVKVRRIALTLALGAVIAAMAMGTYARNQVWSDPIALWKDTVEKSPNKARPHFQLAYAYYRNGQCVDAARHYERVAELQKPDYSLFVDTGLAYDCSNQPDKALAQFHRALELEKTAHAYSLVALAHIKRGQREPALATLDLAEKTNPRYIMTYVYRGNLLLLNGQFDEAATQFQKALAIDPADQSARNGLDLARRRVIPSVK